MREYKLHMRQRLLQKFNGYLVDLINAWLQIAVYKFYIQSFNFAQIFSVLVFC